MLQKGCFSRQMGHNWMTAGNLRFGKMENIRGDWKGEKGGHPQAEGGRECTEIP